MKKTFFLLTLLTAFNAFSIPIQWRVKAGETTAKTFTAYHGETLDFEPVFVHQGNVITNLELSIYWQTNGMGTVWWSAPGTRFTPAMDTGANDYRFFIRATSPVIASEGEAIHEEVIYRANGRIKLLPSPGFTPSELELPVKTLDFATIDIRNAPWATQETADELARAIEAGTDFNVEPAATYAGAFASVVVSPRVEPGLACDPATVVTVMTVAPEAVAVSRAAMTELVLFGQWQRGQSTFFARETADGLCICSSVSGAGLVVNEGRHFLVKRYEKLSETQTRATAYVDGYAVDSGATLTGMNGLNVAVGQNGALAGITFTTYVFNRALTDAEIQVFGNASGLDAQAMDDVPLAEKTAATLKYTRDKEASLQRQVDAIKTLYATTNQLAEAIAGVDVEETDPTFNTKIAPYNTRLTTAENTVAAWEGFWSGDDFKVTVTNYPATVGANRSPSGKMPQLSLAWKTTIEGAEVMQTVWSETWWQEWLMGDYLPTNYFNKTEIAAELDNKADRAWGFYDSTTGAYAPEGYTSISSGNLMLSQGYAFQRTLTTGGAQYWVLCGNYTSGSVIASGSEAIQNGLFALYDSEGNAVIEAYKGDKLLVGADAEAVTVDGTTLVVNYAVESEEHPILYLCNDLATHAWKEESDPDCVATVAWSGVSGAWVARATPKVATGKLFAFAQFYQGGESYVDIPYNVRRMKIGDTLYTLGTTTMNGATVLTLTPVVE